MADRIPLIINSVAEQIQELPSGDDLIGITDITATGNIRTGSLTAISQPLVLVTNISDFNMSSATNSTPIEFGPATYNVGCTLTNSNSRVTVPTEGTYLITGGMGGRRTNNNFDDCALAILKNGSVFPSAESFPRAMPGVSNTHDFNFYVSMPIVLGAGDFVELAHIGLTVGGATALVQSGYFSVTKLH